MLIRRGRRVSNSQLRGKPDILYRLLIVRLPVDNTNQQIKCLLAHFMGRLGDGRQAGAEIAVPDVIIKTDNAQLLRHADVFFVERLKNSQHQLIVADHECCRRSRQLKQAMARIDPVLNLHIIAEKIFVQNRQMALLHGLAKSFQTVAMRRESQVTGHHSDALVS